MGKQLFDAGLDERSIAAIAGTTKVPIVRHGQDLKVLSLLSELTSLASELTGGKSDNVRTNNRLPFWVWNAGHDKIVETGTLDCCFNHMAGLPTKNGQTMPMFDYEKVIFDALAARGKNSDRYKDKHLWVKKATGLGITEFFLRYMAWLCYSDDGYAGAQMCVVTGPNIELAKGLIKRLRGICESLDPKILSTATSIILNGCKIEAYPSHHLDAMRSLPNPRFIFLDEADFFPPKEQKNARDISERYIAKSDPYIVMVSTPNLPGGLYDAMEKEPEETCIYRRLFLPYTVGMNKIYTTDEIDRAKASPSFEREYNLKYGYGIGNIFSHEVLDPCIAKYDLRLLVDGSRVLGVDPAYGSSKFAIVGLEQLDEILYVKEAMQYDRPSPSAMLEVVSELAKDYLAVVVDAAHPGLIRDLSGKGLSTTPINFRKELSNMTSLAARVVKEQGIRIHPAFSDLIYQLKAVTYNERGHPDKKKLDFDLGDAFMSAIYYMLGGDALIIARDR